MVPTGGLLRRAGSAARIRALARAFCSSAAMRTSSYSAAMPTSETAAASPPAKSAATPLKRRPVSPASAAVLKFAKLSENAQRPTRGSERAAGYDLYSAYDYVILPQDKIVVKTDIQIALPSGFYGRVAPRSGLAAKHFIDVGATRNSPLNKYSFTTQPKKTAHHYLPTIFPRGL
ncbi:deoxyuridine 5'-triphosphate nucleotidohydrolase, mitochondrial isoform X2 [Rhinoraja longicauda]